jgi:hypothetical protein
MVIEYNRDEDRINSAHYEVKIAIDLTYRFLLA